MIIIEIGGTIGDIEALPFLEAIRQMGSKWAAHTSLHPRHLVPFIKAAGELKTKPTQQSVAKLREIGIAPHILVCRARDRSTRRSRQKISLFCNVPTRR